MHVVLAQRQFRLDQLNSQVQQDQVTYEDLRLQMPELGSPQHIISMAEGQLGMVEPAKRDLPLPARPSRARRYGERRRSRVKQPAMPTGPSSRPSWQEPRDPAASEWPPGPDPPSREGVRPATALLAVSGARGRVRAFAVLLLMGGCFAAICVKLVLIQGVDSASYLAAGGSEWEQTVVLPGERGAILDRDGNERPSLPQTTIYADPTKVSDPRAEATALAVLGVGEATLETQELYWRHQLRVPGRTWWTTPPPRRSRLSTWPASTVSRNRSASTPQVSWRSRSSGRSAPTRMVSRTPSVSVQLASGGKAGKSVDEIDPQGRQIPGGQQVYQAPVAGDDLVLTSTNLSVRGGAGSGPGGRSG